METLCDKSMTLSIRFKAQSAIDDSRQPSISSGYQRVQYRSKPPSAIHRDSRRQQSWLAGKSDTSNSEMIDSLHRTTDFGYHSMHMETRSYNNLNDNHSRDDEQRVQSQWSQPMAYHQSTPIIGNPVRADTGLDIHTMCEDMNGEQRVASDETFVTDLLHKTTQTVPTTSSSPVQTDCAFIPTRTEATQVPHVKKRSAQTI